MKQNITFDEATQKIYIQPYNTPIKWEGRSIPTEIFLTVEKLQKILRVHAYSIEFLNNPDLCDSNPLIHFDAQQIGKMKSYETRIDLLRDSIFSSGFSEEDIQKDNSNQLIKRYNELVLERIDYLGFLQERIDFRATKDSIAHNIMFNLIIDIFIIVTAEYDNGVKKEYSHKDIKTNPYFNAQVDLLMDLYKEMQSHIIEHYSYLVKKTEEMQESLEDYVSQMGDLKKTDTKEKNTILKNKSGFSEDTVLQKLEKFKEAKQ